MMCCPRSEPGVCLWQYSTQAVRRIQCEQCRGEHTFLRGSSIDADHIFDTLNVYDDLSMKCCGLSVRKLQSQWIITACASAGEAALCGMVTKNSNRASRQRSLVFPGASE